MHPFINIIRFVLSGSLMILWPVLATPAEDRITIITPDAVHYRPDPGAPGVLVAVVAGDPQKGFYTLRVKFHENVKTPPHSHPDTRTVTVILGTYYFGAGDVFDMELMHGYGPGSVIVIPAGKSHFSWARDGEVIVQEAGIGPTGVIMTGH